MIPKDVLGANSFLQFRIIPILQDRCPTPVRTLLNMPLGTPSPYLKDTAEAKHQGPVLRAHEQVTKGCGGCAASWGLRSRGGGQCACRLSRHDMR